jgi:hypothetical protein
VANVKRLFAQSGNRCAFPKCVSAIVTGNTIVGEVCHIKAANPGGPRYNEQQTPDERHGYANLILLCGNHHTIVDDDEEAYTVERLMKMKADHQKKFTPLSEKEAEHGARTLTTRSATSVGQSGGVTAHTINNYNMSDTAQSSPVLARKLQAAEALWQMMVKLRDAFSDLMFVESVLLPKEIDELMKGNQKSGRILIHISDYTNENAVTDKFKSIDAMGSEREKIFVCEKMWAVFFAYRAFIGRLGYLLTRSFAERSYQDWRSDKGIQAILEPVVPHYIFDKCTKMDFHGLQYLTGVFEREFRTHLEKLMGN